MKFKYFLILGFISPLILFGQKNNSIVLNFCLNQNSGIDSFGLEYRPILQDEPNTFQRNEILKPGNGIVRWKFSTSSPLIISTRGLIKSDREILWGYIFETGDSIRVRLDESSVEFEGRGVEKIKLQEAIKKYRQLSSVQNISLGMPANATFLWPPFSLVKSFNDYKNWNSHLNNQLKKELESIELHKANLSSFMYRELKIRSIMYLQKNLNEAFRGLYIAFMKGLEPTLNNKDLAWIFDKDFYTEDLLWLRSQEDKTAADIGFIFNKLARDFNFSRDSIDALDELYKIRFYWKEITKTYKGECMEKALATVMTFYGIHNGAMEEGYPPKYDDLLEEYYNGPYDQKYKDFVKEKEREERRYSLNTNGINLNAYFSLHGIDGKLFRYEALQGKVALIHFWRTGHEGDFTSVYEKFKSNPNVVFVNISVEKNRSIWLEIVRRKKYDRKNVIHLTTGRDGHYHKILNSYLIDSFPTLRILNAAGWIKDVAFDDIVPIIRKELAKLKDGPYIFVNGDNGTYHLINAEKVQTGNFKYATPKIFNVSTDLSDKSFFVKLKKKLEEEPAVFPAAQELFVLSDIEGNFEAFRKLLQVNKIIDEDFNWIFGNGHLVFAGDMFDRGEQVTECLWLIYTLEEKAKAAGGYVHFIMGNHEIMNLQGDHRYVREKYKLNAARMNKTLTELYNENSELGRWLRTKNVVEKIGDLLFTHGGISKELNKLNLTLSEINQLARQHYSEKKSDYGDENINAIMSSTDGPFWNRGYYRDAANRIPESVIDSTLQKFKVNRIVTGHTVTADTVSIHYRGKVINIDTRHSKGQSEALLIEGIKYYRVNAEGKRVLLFVDDKNKSF